jgi:hypothetical protein
MLAKFWWWCVYMVTGTGSAYRRYERAAMKLEDSLR